MIAMGPAPRLSRLVAEGFGLGRLPYAPGTFGSAFALLLALGLVIAGGFFLVLAGFALFTAAGLWAIRHLPHRGRDDAPEIVIDEIAGQFLAVLPLSAILHHVDDSPLVLWPGWVMSFVLFRLVDIVKPWPISLLDRRSGAFWIMADDVAAGAIAGMGTLLTGWAYHAILG